MADNREKMEMANDPILNLHNPQQHLYLAIRVYRFIAESEPRPPKIPVWLIVLV